MIGLSLLLQVDAAALGGAPAPEQGGCPPEMALVEALYCIDRYEAQLVEVTADGATVRPWPTNEPVGKARVKAVSVRATIPQAYVSQTDAAAACESAGKRLCTDTEWLRACKGAPATQYPYGTRRRDGACNDRGAEPLAAIQRGRPSLATFGFDAMNDPRLHLVPGGVARTGRFDRCSSELGIHDMVGNVHEWTASPTGTLRGGYYLDTSSLGEGCDYAAGGHDPSYRDYSTGFRCCADPAR